MAFAGGAAPAGGPGASAGLSGAALSELVGPRGLSLPGSLWARGGALAGGGASLGFGSRGDFGGRGLARSSGLAERAAGAAGGQSSTSGAQGGRSAGARPRFSLPGSQGYRSPSVTLAGAAGRPAAGGGLSFAGASSGADLSRHLFGLSSGPQRGALSLGGFDALGAARGLAPSGPARGWQGLAAHDLARPATGLRGALLPSAGASRSVLDLAHGADRSPRIVPGLGSGGNLAATSRAAGGAPSLTLLRGGSSAGAGLFPGGGGARWQSLAAGQLQGEQPVFDYGVGGGSSASAPRSSLVRFLQSGQPSAGGGFASTGGGFAPSGARGASAGLSPRAERTLVRVLSRGAGAPGASSQPAGGASAWRGPTAGRGATITTGRRGGPIQGWAAGSAPRSLGLSRSAPGSAGRASDRLAAQVYGRASGGSSSGGGLAGPLGSYALPGAAGASAPRPSAGAASAGARAPASPGALPVGPQGWGARGAQPSQGWDGTGPALVAPSAPARTPSPVAGPAPRAPRGSFPEMEHTNLVAGPGNLAAAGAPSGGSEPPARPQEVLYSRAANVDPGGSDGGSQAPSQSSELESANLPTAPQDLSLLVNQLYAQIKRELTIERERRGLMS